MDPTAYFLFIDNTEMAGAGLGGVEAGRVVAFN